MERSFFADESDGEARISFALVLAKLRLKLTRIDRTIRRWNRWSQIEDQTPVIEAQAPEIQWRANLPVSRLSTARREPRPPRQPRLQHESACPFSICVNLSHLRIPSEKLASFFTLFIIDDKLVEPTMERPAKRAVLRVGLKLQLSPDRWCSPRP
jgi:hypothetical protein